MNCTPKHPTLILLFLFFSFSLFSQIPQGINYQSVARDNTGQILSNRSLSVQYAIHDSTPTGPVIYRENQGVTTNAFGIFSTVIGAGTSTIGTFHGINWGSGKYLQVLMDFTGGANFTDMGTSEFMSVPYALYANGSNGDVTAVNYDTAGVLNVSTPTGTLTTNKGVWTTTGNSNLNSNNFIGTIDNNDLILKSHSIEAVRYTAGGAILAKGSTASGVTPASGAGTRMMWIPAKSAFRAGTVSGNMWDDSNIGSSSTGLGTDVLALGKGSVAIGNSSAAMALQSAVFGSNLIANSAGETVLGSYNDTTGSGSATAWNSTDPLFQIGNGNATNRSNAMSVSKGGIITAAGLLVNQNLAVTPDSIAIPAGSTTIPITTQGFLILTSSSLASLTSVTLSAGQKVGQILIIETHAGLLNGVTINNGLNLGLSNNSAVMLIWDGTQWAHLN